MTLVIAATVSTAWEDIRLDLNLHCHKAYTYRFLKNFSNI